MPFIFLDESGQFNKRADGRYFVVGSFTVGDPRRTEKQFRGWQRTRFPRRMRGQSEIKFSDVRITDDLRRRTVKFLSNLDIRIRYSYLERQNIPFDYWHKDKLQSGLLYTNVIGETLEMYLPTDETQFRAFCDRRKLYGVREPQFKANLEARLLPQLPARAVVQIEMIDSTSNVNIQIADWITGALAWHLEEKPLGAELHRILRNNILEGRELFATQKPQSGD